MVYTSGIFTEHTRSCRVEPTSNFKNRVQVQLIGRVCVIGTEPNGLREDPSTEGLSPVMSNMHPTTAICSAAAAATRWCDAAAAAVTSLHVVHITRVRIVDRRVGKTSGTIFSGLSVKASAVHAGVDAGEDKLPRAAGSSLRATNSF